MSRIVLLRWLFRLLLSIVIWTRYREASLFPGSQDAAAQRLNVYRSRMQTYCALSETRCQHLASLTATKESMTTVSIDISSLRHACLTQECRVPEGSSC